MATRARAATGCTPFRPARSGTPLRADRPRAVAMVPAPMATLPRPEPCQRNGLGGNGLGFALLRSGAGSGGDSRGGDPGPPGTGAGAMARSPRFRSDHHHGLVLARDRGGRADLAMAVPKNTSGAIPLPNALSATGDHNGGGGGGTHRNPATGCGGDRGLAAQFGGGVSPLADGPCGCG